LKFLGKSILYLDLVKTDTDPDPTTNPDRAPDLDRTPDLERAPVSDRKAQNDGPDPTNDADPPGFKTGSTTLFNLLYIH
jgi:hypothetical protein